MTFLRTSAAVFTVSIITGAAAAETTTISDIGSFRAAIASARPGDAILIAPGRYTGGLYAENVRGEENNPIVIAAADDKDPPVFTGPQGGSVFLVSPSHVELRGLIIEGPWGNGVHVTNGPSEGLAAVGVVLKNITVRGGTSDANSFQCAIKFSGVSGFRIEGCTTEVGRLTAIGINMVGCHEGVITGCTIRGDATTPPGAGIQVKGGARDIVIENCWLEHAGDRAVNVGGSTGLEYFRPQPPPPYEARGVTVRRNMFIGSNAPIAMAGAEETVIEHNTFYRPKVWVARILQETVGDAKPGYFVPCRNGRFTRNIIVFRSDEIRLAVNVGTNTAPETFVFADNWWYCQDAPAKSKPWLPTGETDGKIGADPLLVDPEIGDLRTAPGSPANAYGAHATP